MMCYGLHGELKRITPDKAGSDGFFAAILTPKEWESQKQYLGFPEYAGMEYQKVHSCKTEIYAKYILGTILFPDKKQLTAPAYELIFYINATSIAIIDSGNLADRIICRIVQKYQHQEISPELFLYGFLHYFIRDDIEMLETYEKKLFSMEEKVLNGNVHDLMPHLLTHRRQLTRLRCYYEQLEDMARELAENEKDYFDDERMGYIHLFADRAGRLRDTTVQLIEYCQTLREVYLTEIDHLQNKNMQFLTVLTSIFFPLTLIAGWYGMNFTHMPELHGRYSYLVIILVSLAVIIGEIIYFKKKKML